MYFLHFYHHSFESWSLLLILTDFQDKVSASVIFLWDNLQNTLSTYCRYSIDMFGHGNFEALNVNSM